MNETIVVNDGQAAVATTDVSGTLSPKSSATDIITVVDTPSGKQAAVVTTSVSGTLSPESSVTDTVAIVDTPSGKQAALKVYNLNGGGGGGGAATKFGVSLDNLLGEVDENGTYNFGRLGGASVDKFVFDGGGIKKVGWAAFQYAFTNNAGISEALFPDLEEIDTYGFQHAFEQTAITRITFGKVKVINANQALYYMAASLSNAAYTRPTELPIKNVEELSGVSVAERAFSSGFDGKATELYNLRIINGVRACYCMLGYNSFLEDIQLDSLESISGDAACQVMFRDCPRLKKAYFYSLTSVTPANALGLGTDWESGIFAWSDGLKEIHFRADAKATIEALDGYATKFGAYYATIFFDLIGTITVNGVAYSRNEPNSIRVDGTKTFVAWKDAGNNIVYTNATSEPAVDTPVYSDAGTTQVGTVSEVA